MSSQEKNTELNYTEAIEKFQKILTKAQVTEEDKLLAKVVIKGEDGGTFYVKVGKKKAAIRELEEEPKAECTVTMSLKTFNKLLKRKLDPIKALVTGKLKVKGEKKKLLKFAALLTR